MQPDRLVAALGSLALAAVSPAQQQPVTPSIPGRVVHLGGLDVDVGPTRVIAREARTPLVTAFRDGTVVVTAGNPQTSTTIRSTDSGQWWQPQQQYLGYLNGVELGAGGLLVVDALLRPLQPTRGVYQVTRWTSADEGLSLQGPFTEGRATLPTAQFDPTLPHWFNDVIEMPNGDLLGVVQSATRAGPWFTTLFASNDLGQHWSLRALVASKNTIRDPGGLLTRHGWPLYYATEPTLVDAGNGHLVCVLRTTNDEQSNMPRTQIGPPLGKYHDLSNTVAGDGIAPALMSLPAGEYFQPGPPNAPLIVTHSFDGGATWTFAKPMTTARGVFPRLASDGAGLLALSYGGLSGVPRWGNAIVFSTDGGLTWSNEVVFGPFLTTGYTAVVAVGPGRFACFFDCTPPQPWTEPEHWWVGAVDVRVRSAHAAEDGSTVR